MDFLYSRNRLNVATSRARCVAVVVASPALLQAVRGRPPRCDWPTRCAALSSWRPREPAADDALDAEPDQRATLTLGLV